MDLTTETIEGSQIWGASAADYGASPYYLTELSDNICDISFLVINYCEKPTKSMNLISGSKVQNAKFIIDGMFKMYLYYIYIVIFI